MATAIIDLAVAVRPSGAVAPPVSAKAPASAISPALALALGAFVAAWPVAKAAFTPSPAPTAGVRAIPPPAAVRPVASAGTVRPAPFQGFFRVRQGLRGLDGFQGFRELLGNLVEVALLDFALE